MKPCEHGRIKYLCEDCEAKAKGIPAPIARPEEFGEGSTRDRVLMLGPRWQFYALSLETSLAKETLLKEGYREDLKTTVSSSREFQKKLEEAEENKWKLINDRHHANTKAGALQAEVDRLKGLK